MCTSNGLHDCSVSLFLMDRVIDRFIAENQQTKSISLCNLKPSFDGWSKICDLIAGNNEVVELQFEACGLTGHFVDRLADAVKNKVNLKSLNLEWNPIRDSIGTQRLFDNLSKLPSLKSFSMRECELTPSCGPSLVEFICQSSSIEVIDVAYNQLGVNICETIADALNHKLSITQINITGNGCRPETIARVELLLERNRKALELKLNNPNSNSPRGAFKDEYSPHAALLAEQLTEVVSERDALKIEVESLRRELTATTLKLEESERLNERMRPSFDGWTTLEDRMIVAERDVERQKIEIEDHVRERSRLSSELEIERKAKEEKGRETESFRNKFHAMEMEMQELIRQHADKRAELTDAKAQLDHSLSTVQREASRGAKAEVELEVSREENRRLKFALHKMETEVEAVESLRQAAVSKATSELKSEVDRLSAKDRFLLQRVDNLESRNAELENERKSLEIQLKTLKGDMISAEEDYVESKGSFDARIAESSARAKVSEDRRFALEAEIRDLDAQVRSLRETVRANEEVAERANRDRDRMRQQSEDIRAELHERHNDITSLKSTVKQLKREFHNSQSAEKRRFAATREKIVAMQRMMKFAIDDLLVSTDVEFAVGGEVEGSGHADKGPRVARRSSNGSVISDRHVQSQQQYERHN